MFNQPVVTLRIIDEVYMKVIGLHGDHHKILYNKFAIFSEGYFFTALYKLGRWDGKVRYYGDDGKTYLYLLEEILPMIIKWGYAVEVNDVRSTGVVTPREVTTDMFSHINHPDTGKPIFLRDDQVEGVNALIQHGNGLCIAGTGAGKAQPLGANILTSGGWKLMGDIRVNDMVLTPSGREAAVIGVFPQGKKDIYTINFHDGSQARACAEHLWAVHMPVQLSKSLSHPYIIQTSDMIEFLDKKKMGGVPGHISIPLCEPVAFSYKSLSIDPYVLGVLLGNGKPVAGAPLLVSDDDSVTDILTRRLASTGEIISFNSGRCSCNYAATEQEIPQTVPFKRPLLTSVRDIGIFKVAADKIFIPGRYKCASITQRMDMLRGLLDVGGILTNTGIIRYSTPSHTLSKDVQEVVWSLGGVCSITQHDSTWICHISMSNPVECFASSIKKQQCYNLKKVPVPYRRVVSIEKTSTELAQCIMVDDPDHLYITDNYVVTHNTFMCAALVTAYDQEGVRSLTIVPDQTLIKQTKETYSLVGLNPGEYSGKRKTLEHKHVVSTWQALKNNPKVVLSFNMIIVDECHGLRGNVLRNMITDQAAMMPYRFGFTGTLPDNDSGKMQVHTAIGPIRHVMPAKDLIDMGVLAKLHINIFQLEEDLTQEYAVFREETPITPIPTYAQFKREYFPDYSSERSYRDHNKDRIQWIAACVEQQRDSLKGNTLCLVDSIPTARKLAKAIPGSYVVNGTDMADTEKRQQVYNMFGDRDDLVVIATVNVAGTGLSINRIFNLVLVDLGKSFIRIIQAIGRGLRKAADKDFVNVIDICSDFKYSKQHMTKRMQFYKEAGYPYKKHKVVYKIP